MVDYPTDMFFMNLFTSTPKSTNPFRNADEDKQSHGANVGSLDIKNMPKSPTNPFLIDDNPTQPWKTRNPFQSEDLFDNSNKFTAFSSTKSNKFRKPVKLPDDYDGRSSLRDYLTHFNRCSIVNEWNEEESAIFLSASLRGEAQKLLHGIIDIDCRNYNKLVAHVWRHVLESKLKRNCTKYA